MLIKLADIDMQNDVYIEMTRRQDKGFLQIAELAVDCEFSLPKVKVFLKLCVWYLISVSEKYHVIRLEICISKTPV